MNLLNQFPTIILKININKFDKIFLNISFNQNFGIFFNLMFFGHDHLKKFLTFFPMKIMKAFTFLRVYLFPFQKRFICPL